MLKVYALINTLQAFLTDRFNGDKDRGATAVEYGLLVALIAVGLIVAISFFGEAIAGLFEEVADAF